MKRRMLMLIVAVAMLAVVPAAADPWPVIEEPVLREDTKWVKTDWGYQHQDLSIPAANPFGRPWPTLMETEGYGGAGTPNAYLRMDDGELMALRIRFGFGPRKDYALVEASVRGTECSGGSFNLYDRRHAWDGHHIVEWIADQEWSNGRVGLHGSSLSGQTAYWIATTQPPSLKAVSANALHSDIYRDIFMVGGVQNNLFPIIWTYGTGPHRLPTTAHGNGTLERDEICQQNQATRYGAGDLPQPQNEPAWAGVRSVDDDWYASHAAVTYAPSIKIPYYQQVNWQDEQVGPRAAVLFNHITPDPRWITDKDGTYRLIEPKTFALGSGDHGWGRFHDRDLWSFLDIWLLDMADSSGLYEHKVRNYFETRDDNWAHGYTAVKSGNHWPFKDTEWRRFYLHENGGLDRTPPSGGEMTSTYLSAAARQNWFWYTRDNDPASAVTTARGYPDAVAFESAPMDEDMVVAGPVMLRLQASLTGVDTDFFVSVSDVHPDGSVSFVQKGLLKASHRRVDPLRSYYDSDGEGIMVQPYRPHTNPQPVQPGEVVTYDIEVFPIGHIFREGHKLLVQIHTPPVVDGLWGYTPTHHAPSLVTIHTGEGTPSWLQLPVVALDEMQPPEALGVAPEGCKVPGGYPCWDPSPLDR